VAALVIWRRGDRIRPAVDQQPGGAAVFQSIENQRRRNIV
jgi:hypothetical protein